MVYVVLYVFCPCIHTKMYDMILIGTVENGHTSTVWDVCFDPDGCLMVTCSDDLTVKIWSLRLSHGGFFLMIHTLFLFDYMHLISDFG